MRLHLTQLGLMLTEAKVGEVGQARPLEDEQPGVRVARHARIGRVEDKGLIERGILFGGGQRFCHRLDARDVEWPLAIGVHLDRAPAPPAMQRKQPSAKGRTVDRLLTRLQRPTVGGHTGECEEDDRDAEADEGKTRRPGTKTAAGGGGNQPPAEHEQDGGRRDEQDGVRRQSEHRVGLGGAGHPRIGGTRPERCDQPGDQQ